MRLSALQRRILLEIAKRTINTLACDEHWLHDPRAGFVAHNTLFRECYDFWPDDTAECERTLPGRTPRTTNARRAAFSRALHALVEPKRLVGALALAWVYLGEGYEDRWYWQGSGKRRLTREMYRGREHASRHDTPVYRMLCLTAPGWQLVESWGDPAIGRCPHRQREYRTA